MTKPADRRSEFGTAQLALLGVATVVLLVFAWTFVD
jgi:hypothetical protein